MVFLEPWFAYTDERILDELRRELAPGHILEGVGLSPIAYRKDCDEVLFGLEDGSGRIAAVHLTFSSSRERDPNLPKTWIFEDCTTCLEYMQAAHASWAGEEKDPDGQFWLKEQQMLNAARRF